MSVSVRRFFAGGACDNSVWRTAADSRLGTGVFLHRPCHGAAMRGVSAAACVDCGFHSTQPVSPDQRQRDCSVLIKLEIKRLTNGNKKNIIWISG